jgi:hypothetical protein
MVKDIIVSEQELSEGYRGELAPGLQLEPPRLQLAIGQGRRVAPRPDLARLREEATRRRRQIPAQSEQGVYQVEHSTRVREDVARCS